VDALNRGLAFGCILLAAACAIGDSGTHADADRELEAFDRDNPACELWTNWEKMCSRSGPNGETFCKEDPVMRVSASSPFCVVDNKGTYNPIQTYSKPQYESYVRFCAQKGSEKTALRGASETVARCVRYQEERPFNGYHLEARRHPWCRNWMTATGSELLLQEEAGNPNRGETDCSRDSCSKVSVESQLLCRQSQAPSWCRSGSFMDMWGSTSAVSESKPSSVEADGERVVIPVAYSYLRPDIPVVGAFCSLREP
jgi:hypothetical protein